MPRKSGWAPYASLCSIFHHWSESWNTRSAGSFLVVRPNGLTRNGDMITLINLAEHQSFDSVFGALQGPRSSLPFMVPCLIRRVYQVKEKLVLVHSSSSRHPCLINLLMPRSHRGPSSIPFQFRLVRDWATVVKPAGVVWESCVKTYPIRGSSYRYCFSHATYPWTDFVERTG